MKQSYFPHKYRRVFSGLFQCIPLLLILGFFVSSSFGQFTILPINTDQLIRDIICKEGVCYISDKVDKLFFSDEKGRIFKEVTVVFGEGFKSSLHVGDSGRIHFLTHGPPTKYRNQVFFPPIQEKFGTPYSTLMVHWKPWQ